MKGFYWLTNYQFILK